MELLEREQFLSLLQQQFKSVDEGEGHTVFISGEAGIGKTALVKAFCRQQQDDCVIYLGACDALFTPRPLAPLYDIIWQVRKDLWPGTYTIEERSELFLKFYHELSQKRQKTLIVFEDIHWADEATIDFIKFFCRRIAHLRCLFIVTYRDDESNLTQPLKNMHADISPDAFTRLQLTPLSREAVYRLSETKGYNAEDVFAVSGGNPFYVTEILATYSPGVPDNIKDSILSVYDRLEEGTKKAWQICSVIPEGLEINRFAELKKSWDEAIDHCFALKIIIVKNDKVIFKHELYRRTIESSLSPFKRIELNKTILALFLHSFEEEGEIERIVQYAKNSNDNKLVVKYAPIAAKQAACVGAHIQAAKLFLTAIDYCETDNKDQLVQFYEAYAYECYLTNQIGAAITYEEKALKIWQEKDLKEQTGNSLRLLSKLWWFEGNSDKAEKYGKSALEILQPLPASKAKAMAFSNMSELKMFSEEISECVDWGNKAIEIAREINDEEVLCHALNNVGASQWKVASTREAGKASLTESLRIALKNSFHEHAGRAYIITVYSYLECKEYQAAKELLQRGLTYCEERNLYASTNYQLYLKARMLMETGNWNEACLISKNLLQNSAQPATIKIGCLIIMGTVQIRRGEPEALVFLDEARILAFKTKEHQRIVPVMIALLENEWLTTKRLITPEEFAICLDLRKKINNICLNSVLDFWLSKTRPDFNNMAELYEPYKLLRAGKTNPAVDFWEKTGCPFEKAFALLEGKENDKKVALSIFQQLGANAVSEKVKMQMRAEGIKKIPRGLRKSTRTNPAQLTNREIDVLKLLQNGHQNKEIAGTLFISPKTADHHVSSILFKLDVNSRTKAITEAVRLGILK